MLYTLKSGRTIELTAEQFLDMTDEDEEYLVAFNIGEFTNSVWGGSSLEHVREQHEDAEIDVIKELLDISLEEKLSDKDFTFEE